MSLPKVLIFGSPFNHKHGGGITLTNLFKGWDKDKIAVAVPGHAMHDVTTEICDTYYQLGKAEFKWSFPFNFIQRNYPSGLISFSKESDLTLNSDQTGLRPTLVDQFFYPSMKWLGLVYCASRGILSSNFKSWLTEFKPDVLYLQVSTRESVSFAQHLCDYLKIPAVIHMMDDWPSTIGEKGLFKKYWRTKIDKEFRNLLNRVDLCLGISDSMTSEYMNRYNKTFKAFHNPIDVSLYDHIKIKYNKNDRTFRILYVGRIGIANKHSVYSFARAVSLNKIDQYKVELDIFTSDIDTRDTRTIGKLNNIKISPPVKHEVIPGLLSEYDLLLLPLDFTVTGFKYAQYSIPTKASEYMISGTPILVFAPKETAISKFCSENECGYCVTEPSQGEIISAIQFLISHEKYRRKLSQNAVRIAKEFFDAEKVRKEFQNLLTDTANTRSHGHE